MISNSLKPILVYNDDIKIQKYLIDIKNGCVEAIQELGSYYRYKIQDYEKIKKYYLMAIDKGDIYIYIQ